MEEESDILRPAKVFFLDTNLSSPVLTTELEATQAMIRRYLLVRGSPARLRELSYYERTEYSFFKKLCSLRGWNRAILTGIPQLLPEEYPTVEKDFLNSTAQFASFYSKARDIAEAIESAVADGLRKRGLPAEGILGTARKLGSEECGSFRDAYEQMCNLFGRAEARVRVSEHTWTRGIVGSVEVWVHPKYALLTLNGKLVSSSLNQVLMLKDKLATRFMLLEHVAPLRLRLSLTTHLQNLFNWQDEVLSVYGNRAYGVLKAVEPMFKTRLSHLVDNIFGSDTAYTRMIVKITQKEDSIRRATGVDAHAVEKLIELVESVETIDELVEMFGCMKSCGHPIIDPVRGGLSAAAEARSRDQTSLVDAQKLRNTFCHIILVSYISKHGAWPKLTFLTKGTKMEVLSTRQERNITYTSYPLEEWSSVEWKKLFEMDYFPNFLELMDDKSISYYRSEKHLAWERGAKPSTQRRLLLEVLRRERIDLEPLVKRISRRDVPEDWRIVSLYPKEREFKEDPRMFAMLTIEMRCFFTCIEANIADNLFSYMPQQTMTKSKTQIQERFLSFTDPKRNPTEWILFLEIDLSRWNLRWRQLVIHMLGHDLNNMFGVKGTFTVTHWFFSLCQIMVRVSGLRPEGAELEFPPETGLAWRDHLGGFEGLNQKLWTAATYAMVEMAIAPMMQSGKIASYELVGQGDNQVVRVGIPVQPSPREEVIPAIRDELNWRLETTCASVNQEVKPDENVESTAVLTYSKDVFVAGVEYPTSLKKHSRLFPVTSMDFPSTAMNAAAVMAGAVAGAESSRHPLCSAVIGWYHTARYLLSASEGYCIHGKSSPKLSLDEIIAAIILPPSIGGFIGTPIASFLYKGGSDPLGKEISSLRLIATSSSDVGRMASRALRGLEEKYSIDTSPNLETLIDNPYGLPIAKSASPVSRVSHLTLEAFKEKVKNVDIRPLLNSSVTTAESVLKRDILSIKPLNPILAHDLFEASGFGTVKVMRKMFLTTRTVQQVAQWANPNITHAFLRADRSDMLWFKSWLQGLPQRAYSGQNSFQLVTKFRGYWGVDLHGVTNYQPLDSYHSSGTTRGLSSLKWSSHSATDLLTTRGPLSGYLGTATREKRSEHGYKIVDAGAPSRSMMKLQLIRSQAYGDEAFNELLDRIGRTRTNVLLSDITDLLDKVVGGSISHKYASLIRSMAASYVGPLNFVTHIRLDTDSIGKISGGAENYPFMTQEFMVLTMAGAKLLNVHRGVRSGELIVDTDEMTPLPDDSLKAKEPQFTVASLPRSRLLYTPDLMLSRTYDSLAKTIPRGIIAAPKIYGEREVIELGFIGFFMAMLRDQNKAKVLADTRGTASLPKRLQLDIAEAHALGPKALTYCMARAILLTTLRDTFRTMHLHPERWDESLFVVHSISTCVRSGAGYWRHPLFMGHPDYPEFSHSRLRYAGNMTIQKRLEARVRKYLTVIINDADHPFWFQAVPTFSDGQAMTVHEALTTAGAKILYRLYIIQDQHALLFGNLFSSYTRLPVGTNQTPDDMLNLLRVRLTKLSTVLRKSDDLVTSEEISRLGDMKGVLVFNDDAPTIMRYSRQLYIGEGKPRPRKPKPSALPNIGDVDHCDKCLPTQKPKHQVMWDKYSRRRHGGVTTSGYTWVPIISQMTVLKNVVMIGAGNGGLSDLLLTLYDCEVVGIDLERDMPSESATLLNYVPMAVDGTNRSRYTQSDLSINTSGDWFDPIVRTEVLNSIATSTTLIIDVTPDDEVDYLPALDESLACIFIDRVYTRVITSRESVIEMYRKIQKLRYIRMWIVSSSFQSDEVIFEISNYPLDSLHSCRNDDTPLTDRVTQEMDTVIPARHHELATAGTCSVIAWEKETLTEMDEIVRNLCKGLLNKPKGRQLLYRDRISIVWAHLTLYAALSENPAATIQDWISEENCETDLLTYACRESIITHLLRYAPRLRTLDLSLCDSVV